MTSREAGAIDQCIEGQVRTEYGERAARYKASSDSTRRPD